VGLKDASPEKAAQRICRPSHSRHRVQGPATACSFTLGSSVPPSAFGAPSAVPNNLRLEGEGFAWCPPKWTFCVPACVALSGLFHGPHLFPGLAPWALLFRTFGACYLEPRSSARAKPGREPWERASFQPTGALQGDTTPARRLRRPRCPFFA